MNSDPFGDPFRLGQGRSLSEIFRRSGGGGIRAPKKPEPPPEEEPEPLTADEGEETEQEEGKKTTDKVVLKNPVWEVEEVGFNEETDISVEAELPEVHAHKTKVDFELFAKTPDGPEGISKCQGTIEAGKAKARIPVYIPQYKDEDGNLLTLVEYYFTAKHSQSDLLKDDSVVKEVDHMADRLIKSHILQDVTFATDKSFVSPRNADALKGMVERIKEWKKEHPDGKMAIFGHTDAVGKEDYNKKLSERRANAIFALLVKDPDIWKGLYNEEKWGLSSTQELLKFLGHDPGAIDGKDGPKTQAAVKAFQSKKGLPANGNADEKTREALNVAFMEACNKEALVPKDFDSIDGKPFAGCSEFNLAEKTQGACAANRRVAVYLLKSNKNFPIQYPCNQGDIGCCKRQVGRKGERRTAGFGCLFYDQLVLETAGPRDEAVGTVRIGLPIPTDPENPAACRIKVAAAGGETLDLALESCEVDEGGLAWVAIENPAPGALYTISVTCEGREEQVMIKDYEFHRYVKHLEDGEDFERPNFREMAMDWQQDPEEDGDTLGNDPLEIEDARLASLPARGGSTFA